MPRVAFGVLVAASLGWPGPRAPAPAVVTGSAADAATLRDGQVVRGEIVATSPAGPVTLNVRRAWARTHVPEWAARWEKAEGPVVARALNQRRQRLESWRRDRAAAPAGGDADKITPWIERALDRLNDEGDAARAPVMLVRLARDDVRSVSRSARGATRLLRMGWVSGFADVEEMKVDDLKDALQGRGYDVASQAPVSIEALTAPAAETDAAWSVRRAATEALYDPDLRFVRHQGLLLPEPAPGQPLNAGVALSGLSALKDLLGETPTDPLADKLRAIKARGRIGAVVTRLDVAPDLSNVSVEIALWVCKGGDRWSVAGSRSVRVRPGDLDPDAGKDLADDPNVASAFRTVEALGLGEVPPEVKQRALAIGAATRKALGQARTVAQADLAALAFPVLDAPRGLNPHPERP